LNIQVSNPNFISHKTARVGSARIRNFFSKSGEISKKNGIFFQNWLAKLCRMNKLFTRHPQSVGETYWQHFQSSTFFARKLFFAFIASLVHALLPFLFQKTSSGIIVLLHDRMVTNRHRPSPDAVAKDPEC